MKKKKVPKRRQYSEKLRIVIEIFFLLDQNKDGYVNIFDLKAKLNSYGFKKLVKTVDSAFCNEKKKANNLIYLNFRIGGNGDLRTEDLDEYIDMVGLIELTENCYL
jgi:Ca2+-binding EF-hand superfamily protein